MSTGIADRIEKEMLLRAPLGRVWQALTNAEEFGLWFGVRFDGPFTPGASVTGTITPNTVDEEVAKHQQPYEGIQFTIVVERIEPQRVFAFRWHPSGADPKPNEPAEPMTLVTFTLEEVPGGVLLKLVESGFSQISLERRAKAFTDNEGGWTMQMGSIRKYVEKAA